MEWNRDGYLLTDDRGRVDLAATLELLRATYWAPDRSPEILATAVAHSLCLSLWHAGRQVGFCRAVTDYCTFAWICDVIIDPAHRGHGLGKWMVECLVTHSQLKNCTQRLITQDAQTLYERFGFQRDECLKRKKEMQPGLDQSAGAR